MALNGECIFNRNILKLFGRTNLNVDYRVNGRVLRNVEEQRDLGGKNKGS